MSPSCEYCGRPRQADKHGNCYGCGHFIQPTTTTHIYGQGGAGGGIITHGNFGKALWPGLKTFYNDRYNGEDLII